MKLREPAQRRAEMEGSLSALVSSRPRAATIKLVREPDLQGRLTVLGAATQHVRLAPDVSLEQVAQSTPGLRPRDLRALVDAAERHARRRGERLLHNQDFAAALNRMSVEALNSPVLSNDQLWRLAYHHAGHALLQMLLPDCNPLTNVSIFPRARLPAPEREDGKHGDMPDQGARAEERLIVLLGGLAAEWIVYEDATDEAWAELDDAAALIADLAEVPPEAGHERDFSLVSSLGDAELEAAEYYQSAISILRENRVRLDMLGRALVEHETLDEAAARAAAGISARRHVSWPNAKLSLAVESTPAVRDPPRLTIVGTGSVARLDPRVGFKKARRLTDAAAVAARDSITEKGFRHRSEPVMSRAERMRYWALALVWTGVTTTFWVWWLRQDGSGAPGLYWVQTVMLFYQTTLLPTVYWMFVRKMRKPVEVKPPSGVKVALITLCVPSHESLSLIRKQLEALQAVDYPHDSWILDEGGSADVRALAAEQGVNYFTRRGAEYWNEPAPPFQAKTKAGNVNAWLDHVASLGLDYEVFVQFDIDHRPRPDYLKRTLGYFRDSEVAWVQAPSVCGNLNNWAARGLTEQDLVFHGTLQMGFYGSTGTPFIIGSHTSYRMSAIREIGGFQPTRAEDHLDTVVLAAHGYTGVFVPELIAIGDGPDTFATYLRQQFAWAHSMIQIFLQHTPRLVRRYTPRQAFQFLFCQSWYTLWSVSLAVLWAIPTLALLIQRPIASVKLTTFLLYFVPVLLASSLMWCETRRWFQPANVKLSWRGILLTVARWPVIVWALLNVVFRVKRPYMITPKGVAGVGPRGFSLYGPGFAMALLPLSALWVFRTTGGNPGMRGYYWLALANAAIGVVLVATTVALEVRHVTGEVGALQALRLRFGVITMTIALTGLLVVSTVAVWTPMVQVIR